MRIRKAVITAAGKGTRQYPATQAIQKEMIPLVDRDGLTKPTVQIILEEALRSGIEEVAIIAAPEDEATFRGYFRGMDTSLRGRFAGKPWALEMSDRLEDIGRRLTLILQESQEGYGHAVSRAKDWVGEDPFLLLLGDHVYIPHAETPVMEQMLQAAERHGRPVYAVHRVREDRLHLYGTVTGVRVEGENRLLRVTRVVEKPDVETARALLRAPGLAEGEYLCFFGMYALTPEVFDCLDELIASGRRERGEYQFASAQAMLAERAPVLALEVRGSSLDMGNPRGLLETQIALARLGPYRESLRALLQAMEG